MGVAPEALVAVEKGVLDEYFLEYQHRYRMHRLIKEYLKERINTTHELMFQKRFRKYYTQYLLQYYATESTVHDIDKHEHELFTESKNIDLFERLLLNHSNENISTEELAALAILASKGYIQFEKFQSSYKQYLKTLNGISKYLDPALCGRLSSHIVKHFYERCKCDTPYKYIENIFNYPCEDVFECEVITQLLKMNIVLNLTQREEAFLHNIQTFKCLDKVSFAVSILIILSLLATITYIPFLMIYNIYQGFIDCGILVLFLSLLTFIGQLNAIVKSDLLIKFFCYLPSILLVIFIIVCLCCCYYKFHPFPFNVYRHLSYTTCASVLIFMTTLLILHIVLFERCSQLPICY